MDKNTFNKGFVILGAGLVASSMSSLFEHLAFLGAATDFVGGVFDGLAVVAFCGAIYVLASSQRRARA
jgi:hypothetical protein